METFFFSFHFKQFNKKNYKSKNLFHFKLFIFSGGKKKIPFSNWANCVERERGVCVYDR